MQPLASAFRLRRSPLRTAAGLLASVALLAAGLASSASAAPQNGHGQVGGTYRGPGDTVPTPATPTDSGPSPIAPGSGGGNLGGGGVPGAGPQPAGGGAGSPLAPPPFPPGLPDSPLAPTRPESPGSRPRAHSETAWQLWWHYNRWDYVDPRGGFDLLATSTSSDFYLGRGQDAQPVLVGRPSASQRSELVLPALAKIVQAGSRAELYLATAHALAKLEQVPPANSTLPNFVDLLTPLLDSNPALVTEKTLLFLGRYGDSRAFVPLASVLLGTPEARALTGKPKMPWRWRAHAAYGLALVGERNLGDEELVARLFRTLMKAYAGEDEPEVRIACLLSAARLGLPFRGTRLVSEAVAMERLEQVRMLVLAFGEEPDEHVRAQLAPALGRFVQEAPPAVRGEVVDLLFEGVGRRKNTGAELQFGCVTGLGFALRAGEDEIDRKARKELLKMAFRSGTSRGARFLIRVALAQALGRPGSGDDPWAGVDETRKVLVRALGRERGESLGWTALALGVLERSAYDREAAPDAAAMRALRDAIEDERSPDAAPALGLALGLAGDQESRELLLERLAGANSDEPRGYFALSLGLLGAQDARHALLEVLEGARNQPFALEQAAIALALLGDGSAGALLLEQLGEASDPVVQASLASSIGWSRDPALLEPLVERLASPRVSDLDQAWTAVAIGRIVDGDRWPWHATWSIGTNYVGEVSTRIEPDYRTGVLDLW